MTDEGAVPGAVNILVVDDFAENRALYGRLIRAQVPEAHIVEADCGEAALAALGDTPPDLVILDAKMPGMGGFEVCRRIKEKAAHGPVLVMMVSGQLVGAHDRIVGLECGADSYLCKPFANAEFTAQLSALLRIRRNEVDLSRSRDAAEAANRAKSESLAMMSHEMRTPLNAVIGMAELLQDMELTTEQRECANTIRCAGESLLALINDVLDLSAIEAGRLDLHHRAFHVRPFFEEALDLVRLSAERKGLRLSCTFAPEVPEVLASDPLRLSQITANLLSNAVKFTERGSIALEVTAEPREDGRILLRFAVRDSGIGIPREHLDRLFQPFSRVDRSGEHHLGEGTGLGLAICRRLAERMGGSIRCESTEDLGSVFHVDVPVDDARGIPVAAYEEDGIPDLSDLRVLVAEDNLINQKVILRMLERLGLSADTALNGAEVLEALRAREYDAVLMDVQMPGMDGIEATRRLRAEQPAEEQPCIIAMTAHALRGDREKFLAAGMDFYLAKPVREEDLRRVLARAARR